MQSAEEEAEGPTELEQVLGARVAGRRGDRRTESADATDRRDDCVCAERSSERSSKRRHHQHEYQLEHER